METSISHKLPFIAKKFLRSHVVVFQANKYFQKTAMGTFFLAIAADCGH